MLIETDALNWKNPIVYMNLTTGKGFQAVLVSNNYRSGYDAYCHLVVAYGAGEGGKDIAVSCNKEGKTTSSSNTRAIYNTPEKLTGPDGKPVALEEAVAGKIKDLGEF